MEFRPRIKIRPRRGDVLMEILSAFLLAAICYRAISGYSQLPETIPVHYNAAGQADGFGPKGILFLLPVIALVLYAVLSMLNRFPHRFNYAVAITPANKEQQYRIATRLIRFLKLAIMLIFGYIVFSTMQQAKGPAPGLGIWFLPCALLMVFGPVLYFVRQSRKQKS